MYRLSHVFLVQLKNNCTINSLAQGEVEYTFHSYKYNHSFIALKCMCLPTNHKALPIILLSISAYGIIH